VAKNNRPKYELLVPEDVNKRRREDYTFTKDELLEKFIRNEKFRDLVSTGAYFYVDDKLVLYHPDTFEFDKGEILLSVSKAKQLEKYCICEKVIYQPTKRKGELRRTRFYKCLRVRKKGRVNLSTPDSKDVQDAMALKRQREIIHAKDYTEDFEEDYALAIEKSFQYVKEYIENGGSNEPDLTFGKLFSKYMDDRDISTNDLADRTGIDPRTIRRLKKDDDYYGSLDYVVMCCLAMNLSPHESDALLYLGSHVLRQNSKKERAYSILLHVFFWCESMFDFDLILCKLELETFTEIIEKEREKHKK